MAHIKVVRRSMGFEQWSGFVLEEVAACAVARERPTGGWLYRPAELLRDGSYRFEGEPRPIGPGETWGRPDGSALFTGRVTVPDEFAGRPVALRWVVAAEVLVRSNGELLDGLDPNRETVPLLEKASGGESFDLELEAYVRSKPDDERAAMRHMRGCIQEFAPPLLVALDEEARAAALELALVREAAYADAVDEDVRAFLARHLREALRLLPPYGSDREDVRAALPAVREYLRENVFLGDASPFGRGSQRPGVSENSRPGSVARGGAGGGWGAGGVSSLPAVSWPAAASAIIMLAAVISPAIVFIMTITSSSIGTAYARFQPDAI